MKIILQFIQELPEEFVIADNEWYANLIKYLRDKIIMYSNPNELQELEAFMKMFNNSGENIIQYEPDGVSGIFAPYIKLG